MKETFEKIRNKKPEIFTLRVRLTLLVMAELTTVVLLAALLTELIHSVLKIEINIPVALELIVLSLIVGAAVTSLLGRMFFLPIKELSRAMEKVADGDFHVQLETRSTSKEIQEVYSGFNLMTQELRATEILQTDFVSNVSHEFKTPINAIEGYATLLQDCGDGDAEERAKYVDKILFNTRRLSNLVGNILLLSKIDNQAIPTRQQRFRLDEQIRQVIVLLEPEWTRRDIEFDVEMDAVEYTGNESLLYHVWYNLIGNAIKFSPVGGIVAISLICRDGQVTFTVDDGGPGIAEEAQKHIFDKFYQADSSHKEEGNGLGLALVKQILQVHEGQVSAENRTGGGCRFTVVLKEN